MESEGVEIPVVEETVAVVVEETVPEVPEVPEVAEVAEVPVVVEEPVPEVPVIVEAPAPEPVKVTVQPKRVIGIAGITSAIRSSGVKLSIQY